MRRYYPQSGFSSGETEEVVEYVEGAFEQIVVIDEWSRTHGLIVIDADAEENEGMVVIDHNSDGQIIVNKLGGNICQR